MSSRGYRLGDVPTALGPMRLTVGGFAEIVTRCEASDLQSLAGKIRAMTPMTARHLATALLRPCEGDKDVGRLSDAKVAALMPAAAQCITDAMTRRP